MAETICAVALDAATYAIDKLYSYRVPDELREQVQIGTRVLVPFGFGNKRAEGVVLAFREDTGEYRLKPIVEALDEQPVLTQDAAQIEQAERLVLPGVGAFKDGMDGLARLGLIEPIRQKAAAGTPLLGICLGMQMLFDESEEFGLHKGLGLIPGRVVKIPDTDVDGHPQKVPHISWDPLYPGGGRTDFSGTALAALKPGEVMMIENVRFHKEEEKNDPEFAKELASLAEVYVNDAFGTAHRAHASTEGVAHLLHPAVAGFLIGKELSIMGKALEKQAGGQLQKILSKLTDSPLKGFFLGLCVTAIT